MRAGSWLAHTGRGIWPRGSPHRYGQGVGLTPDGAVSSWAVASMRRGTSPSGGGASPCGVGEGPSRGHTPARCVCSWRRGLVPRDFGQVRPCLVQRVRLLHRGALDDCLGGDGAVIVVALALGMVRIILMGG
jgi:hypothetical protein